MNPWIEIFLNKVLIKPVLKVFLTVPELEPTFFLVLSTQNCNILDVNSVIVYSAGFIAHVNLRFGTCNNSAHSEGQADALRFVLDSLA